MLQEFIFQFFLFSVRFCNGIKLTLFYKTCVVICFGSGYWMLFSLKGFRSQRKIVKLLGMPERGKGGGEGPVIFLYVLPFRHFLAFRHFTDTILNLILWSPYGGFLVYGNSLIVKEGRTFFFFFSIKKKLQLF